MSGPPVDIGTGHSVHITPGRAATQQIETRQLAQAQDPALSPFLRALAQLTDPALDAVFEYIPTVAKTELDTGMGSDTSRQGGSERPAAKDGSGGDLACGKDGVEPADQPDSAARDDALSSEDLVSGDYFTRFLKVRAKVIAADGFKDMSFETILDYVVPLLQDPFTERFVRACILDLPYNDLQKALDKLLPHVGSLCCSERLSHFVEDLYNGLRKFADLHLRLLNSILAHLDTLIIHQQGHYVVRKITRMAGGEHLRIILAALAPRCQVHVCNLTSAPILYDAIHRAALEDFDTIVPAIAANLQEFLSSPQGPRNVEDLLKRGREAQREALVEAVLGTASDGLAMVFHFARSKQGSYVLEEAIRNAPQRLQEAVIDLTLRSLRALNEAGAVLSHDIFRTFFALLCER
ncbi:mRNA binding protein puf2 [Rhodotorula toruloides]